MSVDPQAILVRRASLADVPAIIDLLHADAQQPDREVVSEPLIPAYAAAFAEIEADPRSLLMVAELGGAVVGTFQLTFLRYLSFRGALTAQVESVHVAASVRSLGIGTVMMRWAIAESRRRGCHRLQLTSNKIRVDAHRFYRRLGFVQSHEGMKLPLG